ncbi:MAG: hypothetical protein HYU59_12090 [Magnetospirillum gryphiswaldense]|nr:hypothetical protein [Magnetospirillum gryphiswaldense]
MRPILISVLLAALPFSAYAANCRGPQGLPRPGAEPALVENHFHYHPDKGLGCVVANANGKAMGEHKGPVSFLNCLKLGAVAVGDDLVAVEKTLGQPLVTSDIDLFTETRLYEIQQRGVLRPHYVVTYKDDHVVAVQLIGPPMVIAATFSGLTLGDDQQKVIDTLGPPVQRCRSKADGPEMWSWEPFPIAVDIIDGYVAGIKVTWPVGK